MLFDEIVVQRTRWHLAALKVELKLFRLKLTVSAYNPGQPRVPAGRRDGGQWTDEDRLGGRGANDDARLIFVGDADDQRYRVDLLAEEGRRHAIREHVGKSDTELFERVQKSQWRSLVANGGMRRNGGFESLETANNLVNQAIETNKAAVDRVASGEDDRKFIRKMFDYKTGREAYSTDEGAVYMRDTYSAGVELRHDPRSPAGFLFEQLIL
ncbi:RNase A-like domain-containing protein [Methylobacterium sp. GC_Met_2]|uniref:RNase A-like domain-containing protein n=1 Tax=Methylobacterium sp. GC_Met_2 TaxID=2937376 RepID=UPI00226B0566|nr:RNase A-like domain-containing protein [Methylobacterium sp. GC_Met_2]